ncbi:STAS domain-containing protein [Dokdonella sp.]|uniref:STAS domain-containing protein n=1 Tax=Dokdonella sp. TaxID=2291710 RepID=UPI003527D48A
MALEIRDERVGDVLVIDLSGRLDTDTSADLELAVQDLLETGVRDFIINLAGVGYVSSAGLRVLLMLGKGVDGNGSLRLAGLNPTVRQVFDVAGFTQLFTILPDRESALAQKIKTSASKPAAAKPAVEEKPAAAKPAASKPEPPIPAPAKPAPAKAAESKQKEPSGNPLAARVLKALGIKAGAKPASIMPADQVARVALVVARGARV